MTARRAAAAFEVSVRAVSSSALLANCRSTAASSSARRARRRSPGLFEDGGGVPLQSGVHGRCSDPAAAASAPDDVLVAARSTASAMRSRWASASTSRPMIRSTTSTTSSPRRDAASSSARWRARPDLGIGRAQQPLVLGLATDLGVGPHLVGRPVGLGHDLAGLVAGVLEGRPSGLVGRLGVALGHVGRLELGPDLLLAVPQRLVDGRQDVLGHHPEHDEEGDELDEEGPVGDQEVAGCGGHGVVSLVRSSVHSFPAARPAREPACRPTSCRGRRRRAP